jgi:hypothetical protein
MQTELETQRLKIRNKISRKVAMKVFFGKRVELVLVSRSPFIRGENN